MFRPNIATEQAQWQSAIRSLKHSEAFAIHLQSVRAVLESLDTANRVVGQENKIGGAQILAEYLKEVTACWEPEADRGPTNESGSEGESA